MPVSGTICGETEQKQGSVSFECGKDLFVIEAERKYDLFEAGIDFPWSWAFKRNAEEMQSDTKVKNFGNILRQLV